MYLLLSLLCCRILQPKARLPPALHAALERRETKTVALLLSATTDMGWSVVKQRLVEAFHVDPSDQVS